MLTPQLLAPHAKTLAEKHGLRATFMPKPFTNKAGSGAHVHISAWGGPGTERAGENLFVGGEGDALGLAPMAYSFIAGLLDSAEGLCAITNPTVNSARPEISPSPRCTRDPFDRQCPLATPPPPSQYKRINAPVTASGATWSPNTVSYTGNNRTHSCGRVPTNQPLNPPPISCAPPPSQLLTPIPTFAAVIRIPEGNRFEFRLPDGAVNPYLLQAALIAAGLGGHLRGATAPPRQDGNFFIERPPPGVRSLPGCLLDAVRALRADGRLRSALGDDLVDSFSDVATAAWDAHMGHVSEFERAATLDV